MKKAILATKVGMTQIFNEDGMLIPVTVLQAGPCVVTQVKTEENDGYTSVQVGFGEIREKLVNKPEKGHFDKAGVAVLQFPKVKASRAPSRDMASPEDLWLTVLNIIVMQVPTALAPIRARFSKENICQVTWDMFR